MKILKITTSLIVVTFSIISLALTETENWEILDQAFGTQELCSAYQNGEHHEFERKSCFMKCDSWNYKLDIHCDSDSASKDITAAELIFTKTSNGKTFSSGKITQNTWEQARRNPLRLKASAAEGFGQKFILESVDLSAQPEEPNVLIAKYSIKSQRPMGELKTVGEGFWRIKTSPGTIHQKVIYKEYTTYSLGKEISSDTLIK